MKKLGLNEIREKFLSFFESKSHKRLKSFSLVPRNDKSLLLIGAGMAPLKSYFTGAEKPPSNRITTCQKCIRTVDIDNVGRTSRHGTFFEMLGNFSFGDYFKKEAITWAWEFLTVEMELPREKLWPSVYFEDDEAFNIWKIETDADNDKIVKLGKEDNFWEIGTGPCGPSSEIYFDRGVEIGCKSNECRPGCDCDRFIEVWNLVFTQFDKDEDGNYNKLKNSNIDTGLGLERLACVMQGVDNLFEVDTVRRILDNVCEIANIKYHKSEKSDMSIRVITDHIRSTVMLISDGVHPGNEGREYVLRRLLRRAVRHGKLLGINGAFMGRLARIAMENFKTEYPEICENFSEIEDIINREEKKFQDTLDKGLEMLKDEIDKIHGDIKVLPGKVAFDLHDTFGFPIDITEEICLENKTEIDMDEFNKLMNEQKQRARDALKNNEFGWDEEKFDLSDVETTIYLGYEQNECSAKVLKIFNEENSIESVDNDKLSYIILDKTVFYAESGGQIGDSGIIKSKDGTFQVIDCKKTSKNVHLHIGKVLNGLIKVNDEVNVIIDVEKKMNIKRNHTATHMLHKALKEVLGEHVQQAGSLVDNEKLRFDFTHFEPVADSDLKKIESKINKVALSSMKVQHDSMKLDEAKKKGATALFGEKYGDTVRVITVGNYSIELCGGNHLNNSSEIGFIKIISETGVSSGVRRIEAITGEKALEFFENSERLLNNLSNILKSKTQNVEKKANTIMETVKSYEKEIEVLKEKLVNSNLDEFVSKANEVNGIKVIIEKIDNMNMGDLRNVGDNLKNKLKSGVVVLGSSKEGKVSLMVSSTKDVVKKGVHSGNIIKEIAKIVGGGGGGRPDMAQAGGKDAAKINEALNQSLSIIKKQLG